MRILGAVLLPLGVLMTIPPAMHSQGNGTFSQPNSALLFGKFRSSIYIVTPTRTIELKDVSKDGIPVYFRVPSLARTLDRIAWSGEKGDHTEIGVYAVRDQSWKSLADVCYAGGGPIAFSPDATKIAFVSAMPPTPMHDVCPTTHQTALQILALATGRITNLSCCGWVLRGRLGW